MVKVVAFKGQYRITIPKELAESKGWMPGTRVRFIELADGTIILKKIDPENENKRWKKKS